MTDFRKKSIHDLRVMAQAFGVTDIFEKDSKALTQAIEIKQQTFAAPAPTLPARPEYDARLMTAVPNDLGSPMEITNMLEDYIKLGLKLSFDEEHWHMTYAKRTDTGTLRMPIRHIVQCAEGVLGGKRV